MKLKKEKNFDLDAAIKEDTNRIIGSFILTKIRSWKNLLKLKWNHVELIIWNKELGMCVLTIKKKNNQIGYLTRLVDKYPPKTWGDIVFLRPKVRYTQKQLENLHESVRLRLENNGFKDLNCFSALVFLNKMLDIKTQATDLFPKCKYLEAGIKDFTQNENLQPIQLEAKKK